MKKRMKQITALVLSTIMASTMLAACGAPQSGGTEPVPDVQEEQPQSAVSGTEPNTSESGPDTSEAVEIKLVLVGEEPADGDAVFEKINEKLKEDINATLDVEYISLSDYEQMYSLMLASGEPIDAIYTSASWCYYMEEAAKGAFKTIDESFIETYLPLHKENMPAEAFEQARVQNNIYMVPNNYCTITGYAALIRGDLRKKYNLDEVTTLEGLEEYYKAVVENEPGMQAYAAAQNNDNMKLFLFNNRMRDIAKIDYFALYDMNGDSSADMPDIRWVYSTEEYKEFALLMKKWCDMGFWSKNAIANTSDPRDAFENGSAASLIWNIYTLGASAQAIMTTHPEWEPEIVDLFPYGGSHKRGLYTGDGIAFPISGENTERAAMALDLLKFDREYYDLIRYGIEGEHWIDEGDGKWSPGPKQADYTYDQISWAFKNNDYERVNSSEFAPIVETRNRWYELAAEGDILNFTLDESNIATETAALSNLFTKYVYLMDLGAVDDVEATLEEFNQQAEAVGLDKIMEELDKQVKEYYNSLGK